MGKIPPSFRPAISINLIKSPSSSSAGRSPVLNPRGSPPASVSKPPPLFRSPSLSDAKSLFSSLISTPRNAPIDPNRVIQSYASIASVKDSISFLTHVSKSIPSFSPDPATFNALLSSSCRAPDATLEPVHSVLNLMVNRGLTPNQVTVDIAVRELFYSGRVDHGIELIREFCKKQSLPDAYTYNFVVKRLCKFRDLNSAYGFIDEMRSSFAIKPDLVTYTILIDNACNGKNLLEATRLLELLRDDGFKPDCFLYNTIMKGYCSLSRGGEAIGVFNKMKEEGVEPDLVTYNTLIFGLAKSDRVKEAIKYLKAMEESGHSPDVVTYTSLMNGMFQGGDVKGAILVLQAMEAKGCEPNSCTYNTLLHGLCKGRLFKLAMDAYEVIKREQMKLETGAYATFVRFLCRNEKVAEAYDVFDYAVESKSLIDVAAYTTLESALESLKKARDSYNIKW